MENVLFGALCLITTQINRSPSIITARSRPLIYKCNGKVEETAL